MKCPHCGVELAVVLAAPPKPIDQRCAHCHQPFVPERAGQAFCSPRCRKLARVEEVATREPTNAEAIAAAELAVLEI
jgi:hypothetical protein